MSTPLTSGLPHPPRRVPLVGDVLCVDRHRPVQDSLRLSNELGPLFERRVLGKRFVFVSGANHAADLMDESRFAKRLTPSMVTLRSVAGAGLFTAYNDEPDWSAAHELLQPAFSQSAMRGYHDVMTDVIAELCRRWDSQTIVDVPGDMTRVTLETIGRTGFSKSFGSFTSNQTDPFVTAMVEALSYAQASVMQVPVLGRVLGARSAARYAENRRYLHRFVDEVIDQRLQSGGRDPDLLNLMLFGDDERGGAALNRVNVRDQVITFLVAGHETTSGALSFALYYLSRHPDIAARARAEVDQVWGDEQRPTYDKVAKLRYVRRILDEALRLWPTAPGFAREAVVDTTIGGDYQVRRGDWFIVLLPGLHRDRLVWGADADEFDPDHFLPENVKSRPGHVYKPFGTGERACIGRQFALHEAVLVLGHLLRRYDLTADPNYRLEITERLTLMPQDFTLQTSRRRRPVGV